MTIPLQLTRTVETFYVVYRIRSASLRVVAMATGMHPRARYGKTRVPEPRHYHTTNVTFDVQNCYKSSKEIQRREKHKYRGKAKLNKHIIKATL